MGTHLLLWYRGVTWPRLLDLSVCCPTLQLYRLPGGDSTTSLISCMSRGPSYTGMWVRVWRRGSSLRHGKIWLHWRETMWRLERMEWITLRMTNIRERERERRLRLNTFSLAE